ncbi:hypothetical protein DRP07_00145 [Archaeoglobales archaeon]|nr:MAG: hypothetical protein DRP07_00145 [Archaeoglobales archaeon]
MEKMRRLNYKECQEPVEFFVGRCGVCDRELFWGFCQEGEFQKNYDECPVCGDKFCKECLSLHILGRHFHGSAKQGYDIKKVK